MDVARPSYLPISPPLIYPTFQKPAWIFSPKELKKEKIPESDLSNLSAIVIDDLSDDIIIPETQMMQFLRVQNNPPPKA